jgi:hypothetical protein
VPRNLPDLLVGATSNNSAIPPVEVRPSNRICPKSYLSLTGTAAGGGAGGGAGGPPGQPEEEEILTRGNRGTFKNTPFINRICIKIKIRFVTCPEQSGPQAGAEAGPVDPLSDLYAVLEGSPFLEYKLQASTPPSTGSSSASSGT